MQIMKIKNRTRKAPSCLLTVALISIVATLAARAASPPALNARVIPRPVTPNDVAIYSLPANTVYSGGLSTIAIGTPAYLEADVNIAVPAASITNVSWTLTAPPHSVGRTNPAALLSASPIPLSVPVYLPSDKLVYQVAGRILFMPDYHGQYTVTATIATTNGTTNVTAHFNAGTYEGVAACEFCHGGDTSAPDTYPFWTNTLHASIFTQGINGVLGSHYSQSCLQCHTVGYNTNASALGDGGFYGVAQADGWTFPTLLTNSNWAGMEANYPDLANVANIQCENCHGPASEHFDLAGNINASNFPALDVSYTSGDCNQCHDDPPHHYYGTQWLASSHAITTTTPSGNGRDQCVQCHTAYGFITAVSNRASGGTIFAPTNTTFAAIGCQTCHEPHGMTIPTNDNHLIRVMASATFGDGTVITNGGEGNLCMNCHHSRNGSAVTNVANWPIGIPTWSGASEPPSSRDFGPHDNPQGDMIEGINAITYGKVLPSSAHRYSVTNTCVGCHMQALPASNPGYLLAGGHTWEMSYNVVTNGITNKIDQVAVCNQCHGGITTFNFPVEDYANTGVIQGVQTEVQILLSNLSTWLPNKSGVVDGLPKGGLSVTTNWSAAQLKAAYNWQFVVEDGSYGVHNAPFATGLLKASIADLSGTSVPGGLPDEWEMTYFGSITNANGAPDANPSGDGIPNWLKYALGLDPRFAGVAVSNGVVYADGTVLGGSANTVQIYTAAEVAFETQPGTNYQIQGVSALSGGWQDIGTNIVGNGDSISYLTPTRGNVQQYFRVVHNP